MCLRNSLLSECNTRRLKNTYVPLTKGPDILYKTVFNENNENNGHHCKRKIAVFARARYNNDQPDKIGFTAYRYSIEMSPVQKLPVHG